MTKYTFDNARRWTPQRFASLVDRHDVVVDELDANRPDLVHTRLVVLHVPERDRALERIAHRPEHRHWSRTFRSATCQAKT